MASFPDSLPPQGLDTLYKLLLYYTVFSVIIIAITTKLVTRNRLKSINTKVSTERPVNSESGTDIVFDNERDNTSSMIIKMAALETSLDELSLIKNDGGISDVAYGKLSKQFNDQLEKLIVKVGPRETTPISTPKETTVDTTEEQPPEQLINDLGLNEDDEFLKPKVHTPVEQIIQEPVVAKSFTAPKPTAPKSFTAPKPTSPKAFTAPKPTAPKSFTSPKPTSPIASPKAVAPQQSKVPESDQKGFAKSTSIAAIRMDMLRELARLKKLINEDE